MGFLAGFARGIGPGIERAGAIGAENITQNARRREDRANKLEDKLAAATQKAAELGVPLKGGESLGEIHQLTAEFQDPAARSARQREETALGEGYEETVNPDTALTTTASQAMAAEQQRLRALAQQTAQLGLGAARHQATTADPEWQERQDKVKGWQDQSGKALTLGIPNIYNDDWSVNGPQMAKYNKVSKEITDAGIAVEKAKAVYYATPRSTAATEKMEQNSIVLGTLMPDWIAEIAHYPDNSEKHILEDTLKLYQNTLDPSFIKKINEQFNVLRTFHEEAYTTYRTTKGGGLGDGGITTSITGGETATLQTPPGETAPLQTPPGGTPPVTAEPTREERTAAALARSEGLRGGIREQDPSLGGTTVAPPNAAAPGGGQAPALAPEVTPAPVDTTGVTSAPTRSIPGPIPEPTPEQELPQVPSLGEVDLGDLTPEDRTTWDKAEGVMAAWEAKMADEGFTRDLTEEQKVDHLTEIFYNVYATIKRPLVLQSGFDESSHPLLAALRQKYPQYAGILTNE